MCQLNVHTWFRNNSKCKNCLWKSDLWLQDADEHEKLVLNVNLIKVYDYGRVDISVQSHNCQDFFLSVHLFFGIL